MLMRLVHSLQKQKRQKTDKGQRDGQVQQPRDDKKQYLLVNLLGDQQRGKKEVQLPNETMDFSYLYSYTLFPIVLY